MIIKLYFAYSLMIKEQEKKFNPVHQISNHSTEIEGQKRCLHMHKTRIGIPNARRNGSCEGIVVEMPTTLQNSTSLNIWWQRNALKNYISDQQKWSRSYSNCSTCHSQMKTASESFSRNFLYHLPKHKNSRKNPRWQTEVRGCLQNGLHVFQFG